MKVEIDFPFHGYKKADLIRVCYGENADVDPAIPLEEMKRIKNFIHPHESSFWYVMDYTQNKTFGRLVNLKEKFFDRVASLYLEQLPRTMDQIKRA